MTYEQRYIDIDQDSSQKSKRQGEAEFSITMTVRRKHLLNINQLKKNLKTQLKIQDLISHNFQNQDFYSWLNGDISEIYIHEGRKICNPVDGDKKLLLAGEPGVNYNLKLILGRVSFDASNDYNKLFISPDLISIKHLNDIYFGRETTMVHMIKNRSQKSQSYDLLINEYFPFYIQLYLKDVKAFIYSPTTHDPSDGKWINEGAQRREITDFGISFDKGKFHFDV